MATLFDLPPQDVLFTQLFSYLRVQDIWVLRLVCHEMHSLCWDYFSNVCVSLSVCLASDCGQYLDSMVGLGAGIAIFRKSRRIQSLKISGLDRKVESAAGLQELLRTLIAADGVLKRLCFSRVDLSSTVPLLERLSLKCQELKELELCCIGTLSVQWTLAKLLQHSKQTLLKLSIKDVIFSPSQPLPVKLLYSLRYLSITDCGSVSSEGCLEELFRKCPLLEVVDLCDVWTVTNRTLLVLTEYCSHLQQVAVKGCPLVTMEAIIKLQNSGVVMPNIDRTYLMGASKRIPGQI